MAKRKKQIALLQFIRKWFGHNETVNDCLKFPFIEFSIEHYQKFNHPSTLFGCVVNRKIRNIQLMFLSSKFNFITFSSIKKIYLKEMIFGRTKAVQCSFHFVRKKFIQFFFGFFFSPETYNFTLNIN